jgi:hypothetical protein
MTGDEMATEMLSTQEGERLVELEAVIEKEINGFLRVGSALLEIRDSRLYRSRYDTFEDYCRSRWKLSRQYAYQMIAAAEVAKDLSANADILPATEFQSRALAQLPREERSEAWKEAQDRAASYQPPARIVNEVVQERKATRQATTKANTDPPPAPKVGEFVEVVTPGASLEEVEAQREAEEERKAIQQESKTQEQLDEEYIKSLPLYGQLKNQQLRNFVADVRIWLFARREVEAARKKLSEACNKFRMGRYGHRARWFFRTDAPDKWIRCADPKDGGCGGTGYRAHGTTRYECPECKTDGYRING